MHIRNAMKEAIVAGNFNAKHAAWNSPTEDRRGKVLMDLAQSLDMLVCNQGHQPTREKDGHVLH